MRFSLVFVVAVAGAFSPSVVLAAEPAPAPAVKAEAPAKADRWTDVRVVAELRAKDTAKVDVVTAGDEQKSSFRRCAKAADVFLCRALIAAVNIAAAVGTNIPTK